MKQYFLPLAFILTLILAGCKKDESLPTESPIKVEVRELTTKTSVSIQIETKGKYILNLVDKFGNTTYESENASGGDVITVKIKANLPSDLQNNGNGTLIFSYKGKSFYTAGGAIGVNWKTNTFTLLK
jgi:hypothetical protein